MAFADAAADRSQSLSSRVVILANGDDADSLRVARHYADARAVPAANIVALSMPTAETITWAEFIARVWEPLLAQLVKDHWIDAIPMDLRDEVGRRKYAVNGHRMAALVVCRGVPLRISYEPAFSASVSPASAANGDQTNAAAVDSELSLLPSPNHAINGFIPNPLFQNEQPSEWDLQRVLKVSRLDGPTTDEALALVDGAMQAEQRGLFGRAYVDLGGGDPAGNAWLEATAKRLTELDYDTAVDREPGTMPASARMDAPALYFGWYAQDLNGPFALPGFRFPPGAIAVHIHSFSAATLRSPAVGWTGPLIARGVAATVGNVYEPYLQLTHRPDLMIRALARGADLVDAAYFSLPALSWQGILIGDPLYRPFAVPLAEQLTASGGGSSRLAGYAVLRRVHELDARRQGAEATALLRQWQREHPSLAVSVALAERLHGIGDDGGALDALGFAQSVKDVAPDEWALMAEAAKLLGTYGRPDRAVGVWTVLFQDRLLPADLENGWLRQAIRDATTAGDAAHADAWRRRLAELGGSQ